VSDDEVVFDTTNVPVQIPRGHGEAYTKTAPVWLCDDCATYRQTTHRSLYWIVGVVLTLGAVIAIFEALL
jgi:hypothetical protein